MTQREQWQAGHGPIQHHADTVARMEALAAGLAADDPYALLAAADRLCCAAMSVVAHMTYARRIDLDGAPLAAEDFKPNPEGHTGGSLNMVPAFVGYLLANALSGKTRGWLMGQGHCVAAIEAVNALTGDVSPAQRGRYDRSAEGLARLLNDFYSYAIDAQGLPAVPLGSHAGPNTAGAVSEGGYLGFAGLQYVHMPLPGEGLVAFLSDGAFEEQRGSDWATRWWRAEDCGTAVPVMILNGRRIEQRTQIVQEGGAQWLADDLWHNGFEPLVVDGRDPSAIAWAILTAEEKLAASLAAPGFAYPARLPYVIAVTEKGYGFPGAGTNAAHNLPLAANPRTDAAARQAFNDSARRLYVPGPELDAALAALANHRAQGRPLESGHPMAHRQPPAPALPAPAWEAVGGQGSAMAALDGWFIALLRANPALRVRVGNPDELASNKMGGTLALLKHRVNHPEDGVPEDLHGAVITALNEEAVAAAALANKAGLNLIVSYEAFAVKMLGLLRQEIIFARRQKEFGQSPAWLSVPLVVTSHTWENAKNEQSHQDPTIGEALLGEMSDTARVLFPVDGNSAVAALRALYGQRAQVACVVVSKRDGRRRFDGRAAQALAEQGAAHVAGDPAASALQFVAIGAYQLEEALKARAHLARLGHECCVSVILEPGRLRAPRDGIEADFVLPDAAVHALFPPGLPRVLLCHTRPEPMLGVLRRLDDGPARTRALGYISRGGTLDVAGMLFANRSTWAHAVDAAAAVAGWRREDVLDAARRRALDGQGHPDDLLVSDL
ncbi:xylulose 5-phosphate 3-epimerase [Bordetella pseudohinzii]|uniref:Xylulose 5-phosphate 3-epimerase n=1 Tax=Bordetella pseudohinzii TaxID=1331258 RepID=A0A0J6BVZ8_9BORD|nr:xylulose 5-phosphate 3-epimerase [Bordetella pseudohinzii]ANY14926.1 xylulose 5-phosphate 3-epimerase [Bordetella pseudohinzii]KMM25954.1 xylulose 5-phosphate 3-epimerase [Bordetella pseudohinzii]KXA76494.1 xylulose 5-phosphate 3-epimerase [Bordetella pseudohinzii]KXA79279.1 xylulose 5-phosphate 3-epimerase [Bordetella pseudohinzii]CUI94902.1 Xylulose-5-phosphate phosphoketolase [Bordetella pseudohinzii]